MERPHTQSYLLCHYAIQPSPVLRRAVSAILTGGLATNGNWLAAQSYSELLLNAVAFYFVRGGGTAMVLRADKQGPHRVAFERNKKRILKTQHTCGICGQDVDKTLAYPHPMSPVIDHIIPVSKGGNPSSIDNLQLAHWKCNRDKSDKLYSGQTNTAETIGNRNLPKTIDWDSYEFKT